MLLTLNLLREFFGLCYKLAARRFLSCLRATFPRLRRLSQLRRDPHLLGWFRSLCQQQPPLSNRSRILLLVYLRPQRLLHSATSGRQRVRPQHR